MRAHLRLVLMALFWLLQDAHHRAEVNICHQCIRTFSNFGTVVWLDSSHILLAAKYGGQTIFCFTIGSLVDKRVPLDFLIHFTKVCWIGQLATKNWASEKRFSRTRKSGHLRPFANLWLFHEKRPRLRIFANAVKLVYQFSEFLTPWRLKFAEKSSFFQTATSLLAKYLSTIVPDQCLFDVSASCRMLPLASYTDAKPRCSFVQEPCFVSVFGQSNGRNFRTTLQLSSYYEQ